MSSPAFFFACDLHGHRDRYRKLLRAVELERPRAVLLGGDLLPHALHRNGGVDQELGVLAWLQHQVLELGQRLGEQSPRILLILGNDDDRAAEGELAAGEWAGAWEYLHGRCVQIGRHPVLGYSFVPPTPFQLKDWERYDVSRYVDPGCISPEEGHRTVPVAPEEARYRTISADLEELAAGRDLEQAVFLFHSPPHDCLLDRAALDGQMVDHVPLDVHVGSIAIRRFIDERQPLVTLHGHVHESARLTGAWRQCFGRTHAFSAAHDGPELALVRFDPARLQEATRELL